MELKFVNAISFVVNFIHFGPRKMICAVLLVLSLLSSTKGNSIECDKTYDEDKGVYTVKNCMDFTVDLTDIQIVNVNQVHAGKNNNNSFSKLENDTVNKFSKLEQLDLFDCKIHEISEGAFNGLSSLKNLHLSENNITQLKRETFESLMSLEKLHLDSNGIEDLDSKLFQNNKNLTFLNLNGNKLKKLHIEIFYGLTKMTRLYLDNNQIETLQENLFDKNGKLEILSINNNRIESIHQNTFQNLSCLQELDLTGNICDSKMLNFSNDLISVNDNLNGCYEKHGIKALETTEAEDPLMPPENHTLVDEIPSNENDSTSFIIPLAMLIMLGILSATITQIFTIFLIFNEL